MLFKKKKKILLYKQSVGLKKNKNLCTVDNISDVMVVQFVLMRVHVSLLTIIKFWSIYGGHNTHTHTPLTLQLLFHSWLLSLPLCWSPFNVWINTKDNCALCSSVCVCVCDWLSYTCMCWLLSVRLCHQLCPHRLGSSSDVSQLSLGLPALDGRIPPLPLCLPFA